MKHAALRPHLIDRPWGRMCVRSAGQGPTIMLVHGLCASGRYWEGLATQLGDSYHLIAPDLGGFGASGRPHVTYDLEFHLANLDAALSASAATDTRLVVIGHSLGGLLAAAWAGRHLDQIDGLALVAAPYPRSGPDTPTTRLEGELDRALYQTPLLAYGVHAAFALAWPAVVLAGHSKVFPRAVIADYMRHSVRSALGTARGVLFGAEAANMVARAADVRGPRLLLYGRRDRQIAANEASTYQAALGASDLRWNDGGHHLLLTSHYRPLIQWLTSDQSQVTPPEEVA
jgi:pimeloyl-ACP methyl ester carboxylesterase